MAQISNDSIYTAVLWGYRDDKDSIGPLESSDGNLAYWTDLVGNDSPEFRDEITNYTGLYMYIFAGDVPADAPWDGTFGEPEAVAYVSRKWTDAEDAEIAARLVHTEAANIRIRRA